MNVLLIEDDNLLRVTVKRYLQTRGIEVLEATSAEAALEIRDPYHLVITDFKMPGMDGLALTRTLRSRKETAEIPVIMISGSFHHPDGEAEALRAGVSVCIQKPFSLTELASVIAQLESIPF